jgi:hypothetical protein
LEKAKEIHDELEVDIAAYNKHWLNLHHFLNVNGFNQMVKGCEAAIQSITAHNTPQKYWPYTGGGDNLFNVWPHHRVPGSRAVGEGSYGIRQMVGNDSQGKQRLSNKGSLQI